MRILLVEDNADHRELMCLTLTGYDAAWQVEGVVSGEEDDILSGESWLEGNEVIAYREFLRQENQKIEDSIRKATSAGRPFGSEEFLIILEKILERNIFPRKSGRPRKESL
jgi:CheY-like chemotaxis protein